MQSFTVRTSKREEFVDITSRVVEALGQGACAGLCQVFVPHTTASVTINENADPSVVRDLLAKLRQLAPRDDGYEHSEGNSDGHLKASLMGSSVLVPVAGGRLALGAWQGIYLCEFDGPRSRQVHVQLIESGGR
jgi:secondary thiamine-phosphate synthase enzyme